MFPAFTKYDVITLGCNEKTENHKGYPRYCILRTNIRCNESGRWYHAYISTWTGRRRGVYHKHYKSLVRLHPLYSFCVVNNTYRTFLVTLKMFLWISLPVTPAIHPSIRPSFRPSVRPSEKWKYNSNILTYVISRVFVVKSFWKYWNLPIKQWWNFKQKHIQSNLC